MAILKRFKTPFGDIRVTRDRDGIIAYYQNGCFHSQATARGVSICGYVHLAYQLICLKKARRVLIIGCGGGTLATMLSRHDIRVTVVDINPVAFTIARDYFRMPKSVMCVAQDGMAYVRDTAKRFDAVVIDVFDENNNVPDGFTAKGFLRNAKKIIRHDGIIVMNVIAKDAKDNAANRIAKHIQAAGMGVAIHEWSKHKDSNILIVGARKGMLPVIPEKFANMPTAIKQELKKLVQRIPKKA